MLHGYPVYVVRQIRANERHLVEEQLKEAKRRILWQQMYDGFFTYRHYGIALSDGSFVHFRGNINFIQIDACIMRTKAADFAPSGCICRAIDITCAYPAEEIARRALSQVNCDFGGYNFLSNNCEHFASWCANGKRLSKQVLFR